MKILPLTCTISVAGLILISPIAYAACNNIKDGSTIALAVGESKTNNFCWNAQWKTIPAKPAGVTQVSDMGCWGSSDCYVTFTNKGTKAVSFQFLYFKDET